MIQESLYIHMKKSRQEKHTPKSPTLFWYCLIIAIKRKKKEKEIIMNNCTNVMLIESSTQLKKAYML